VYLHVVPAGALAAEALHLEGALEGDGDAEARGHHDVPAAVQAGRVVLGETGAAHQPPVGVQETPTA